MKRSELKAIIKECLIEILNDEREVFASSSKKAVHQPIRTIQKESLLSIEDLERTPRPSIAKTVAPIVSKKSSAPKLPNTVLNAVKPNNPFSSLLSEVHGDLLKEDPEYIQKSKHAGSSSGSEIIDSMIENSAKWSEIAERADGKFRP